MSSLHFLVGQGYIEEAGHIFSVNPKDTHPVHLRDNITVWWPKRQGKILVLVFLYSSFFFAFMAWFFSPCVVFLWDLFFLQWILKVAFLWSSILIAFCLIKIHYQTSNDLLLLVKKKILSLAHLFATVECEYLLVVLICVCLGAEMDLKMFPRRCLLELLGHWRYQR